MARTGKGIVVFMCLVAAAPAAAQTPARIDPERLRTVPQELQIDPTRLQARDRQLTQVQTAQQFADPGGYESRADNGPWIGWVNFNRSTDPVVSNGTNISRTYEEVAGGVRFGLGDRQTPEVVLCRDGSRDCAGGSPSGGHALRDVDGVLRIDFAQPVFAVTVAAAPDWTRDVRAEVFQIEGWGNGDILVQAQQAVSPEYVVGENWVQLTLNGQQRQTATVATTPPGAVTATEFDYVIIRAFNANGAPVNAPILIDDLRFADNRGSTPLDDQGPRTGGLDPMLDDTRDLGPGLQREAEVIREGGTRENSLYPVARRIRMAIDYEAAEQAAQRQRADVNLQISIPTALGRADDVSVPILAPLGAFESENPRGALADGVAFMGRPDFYHLILPTELGEAVITGTRLASPSAYGERNVGTLQSGSGYDGAFASFNLYGVAYAVRITCEGVATPADGRTEEPPCNNPVELDALLDRLFLFIPPEEDRQ